MVDQTKRKGRKTIARRAFYKEELEPLKEEKGKNKPKIGVSINW